MKDFTTNTFATKPAAAPSYKGVKPVWPMPLAEFIARRKQSEKAQNLIGFCFLVIFFGGVFSLVPLGSFAYRVKETSPHIKHIVDIIGFVVFFGYMIGSFVVLMRLLFRKIKEFGLQCPQCGSKTNVIDKQPVTWLSTAIATGQCCNCAALLISDHPANVERNV